MAIQIKLKNSVVQDSTPSTSDLPAVGEIALNANINSIGGFMRASDNSIVKIFGPGSVTTPTATTTVSGIAELATSAETTTGSATNRVVTPAGLNAVTVAERTTSNNNYVAKAGSTMTGVLQLTAGSTSAPAINFGASNTGIYQASGANNIRIAVDGSDAISASTAGGINFVPKATALTSLTLGSQSATDKPLFFADAGSVESASLLLDNSSNEFRVRNNRFSGKIVFAPSSNAEKARIDNGGRLLVGHSSSLNVGSGTGGLIQLSRTTGDVHQSLNLFKADNAGSILAFGKSRSATIGSYTVVQDDDELGVIRFAGADGTDLQSQAASISAFVDGTPGSNDMPGRLVFSTTADGANSPTTRLTIDSAGLATFAGNITMGEQLTISATTPNILFTDTNNNPDYRLKIDSGAFTIEDAGDNSDKFVINSDGHIDIINRLDAQGGIAVTGAFASSINDNATDAFTVKQGSNEYITVDTNNSSELITLGNTTTNPKTLVLGNGLLVGTTTEGNTSADDLTIAGSGDSGITIRSGTSSEGSIMFSDATSGTAEYAGWINYNHNDNFLRFFTNSSERFRVDQNGRLGIGTSSVSQPLHLANSSGNTIFELQRTDSNTTGAVATISFTASDGHSVGSIGMLGDGDDQGANLVFRTTSAAANNDPFNAATPERMRLDSSGKLGLGTNSPQRLLHLSSDNTVFALTDTAASTDQKTKYILTDAGILAFGKLNDAYDTATEYLRITDDGNLGLGIQSPTKPSSSNANTRFMEISSADGADLILGNSATSVSVGDHIGALAFKNVDANPDSNVPHYAGIRCEAGNTSGSMDLRFYVGRGNLESDATNMIISSAGLVGIGTSSPACALHIDNPSDGAITQILDTDNSAVKLVFRNNTETGNAVQIGANGSRLVFVTGSNERGSFDADGRLLIGSTSSFGDGTDRLMIKKGNDGGRISFGTDAGFAECIVGQLNGYWGNNKKVAAISFFGGSDTTNKDDGNIRFATSSANNLSERMRINEDGRVLINTLTVLHQSMLTIKGNGVTTITTEANLTSAFTHHIFNNPNGQVGDIRTSGSSTIYNTSSDYRLKENVVAITDGITRLKTLKPYRFNFKADKDTTVDGFFAHEVTAVPEAISGEKDAVNEDGSINPQGIDQSKLVPLLVAAVQELIGRVEKLEAA